MADDKFDVIVVGAGPAGCSAALHLARYGYKVLLIDKSGFPREKICGEHITSASFALLEDIGLASKFLEREPWKITHLHISFPTGKMVKTPYPEVKHLNSYTHNMKRVTFDNLLFESARTNKSVTVIENCEMKNLIYEDHKILGVRCLVNNQKEMVFFGTFIMGADGVYSRVAKEIGLYNNIAKHRCITLRAYFENVDNIDHCNNFLYERSLLPGYGWIFPIDEKSANVGIGIVTRYKLKANIHTLYKNLITENPIAKDMLKKARMKEKTLKGWPITLGSFNEARTKENVILVGDAGSFVDPFTGEGIYQALKTGKYAADAIYEGSATRPSFEKIGRIYKRLWQKEFKWKDYVPAYISQVVLTKGRILDIVSAIASVRKKILVNWAGTLGHQKAKWQLLF